MPWIASMGQMPGARRRYHVSEGTPPVPAIWDSVNSSAGAVITGDGKIVGHNGSAIQRNYRGTIGKSSGKWYFEIYMPMLGNTGGPNDSSIGGICTDNLNLVALDGTAFVSVAASAGDINGFGALYRRYQGYPGQPMQLYKDTGSSGFRRYYVELATGWIGVAVDLDAGKLWSSFSRSYTETGVLANDIAWWDFAGTGGTTQNPRDLAAGMVTWTPSGQIFYPAACTAVPISSRSDNVHHLRASPDDIIMPDAQFESGGWLEGFTKGWYD